MMSHLSCIIWEQCTDYRLAPSEMKLRCHIWESNPWPDILTRQPNMGLGNWQCSQNTTFHTAVLLHQPAWPTLRRAYALIKQSTTCWQLTGCKLPCQIPRVKGTTTCAHEPHGIHTLGHILKAWAMRNSNTRLECRVTLTSVPTHVHVTFSCKLCILTAPDTFGSGLQASACISWQNTCLGTTR